jgi:hypothetical protein
LCAPDSLKNFFERFTAFPEELDIGGRRKVTFKYPLNGVGSECVCYYHLQALRLSIEKALLSIH